PCRSRPAPRTTQPTRRRLPRPRRPRAPRPAPAPALAAPAPRAARPGWPPRRPLPARPRNQARPRRVAEPEGPLRGGRVELVAEAADGHDVPRIGRVGLDLGPQPL